MCETDTPEGRIRFLLAWNGSPAVVRFSLEDVRHVMAELERTRDDNRLLRQRLAIAWAEQMAEVTPAEPWRRFWTGARLGHLTR